MASRRASSQRGLVVGLHDDGPSVPELVDAFHGSRHCVHHVGAHALDRDDPGADRPRVAVLHDQEGYRLVLLLPPGEGVVEADLRHSPGLSWHTEVHGVISSPGDAHFAPDAKGEVRRLVGFYLRA